jgi:hypothetical protein
VRSEKLPPPQVVHPDVSEPVPRRRILIVDDNIQAADSLGRLMSEVFGQEVRVVYDGITANDLRALLTDLKSKLEEQRLPELILNSAHC